MIRWPPEIRQSLRSLSARPGFVIVTILSLAIGIGVNAAIFSIFNALMLRPIPVRDLTSTVVIYDSSPGHADSGTSFPEFLHHRDRTEMFSHVMAFGAARPLSLVEGDRRDQIYAELVTADFFAIADVRMRLGRPFDRDVDRMADPPAVALMSHALWQRRFGADPGILGRRLLINGQSFDVLGVVEEGFTGLDVEASADLWIPMTCWALLMGEPARLTSDEHWITTIATLQPGVTLARAQAAVAAADQQTKIRSARERATSTDTLAIGASAFAVGLLVLVLACANVVSLLFARAAARQREMSVRIALGSSRARLVRLWLIECLMLCLAAGAAGLLLGSWLVGLAERFKPPALIGQPEAPILPIHFHLDARVFAFVLGLSSATALIVGLIAGLQGSRIGGSRFAPGFNLRSTVIAFQMALSLMLLIPCGLLVRTSLNATSMDPGFSPDHVLLLPISDTQAGVRVQKPANFEQQLADRVTALPGVEHATIMDPVPLWFGGSFAFFAAEGREPQRIGFARIDRGYFDTLHIPLMRGRDFNRGDRASAPQVAIVNETLARRFWPNEDAIGHRLRHQNQSIEVIGIAKDAKYSSLGESSQPWLYLPIAQNPTNNPTLSLAVRTTVDPVRIIESIEREVRSLVPHWPAFQFRTLDEGLALQQRIPRLGALLLGVLGIFGALLASVGVYGVMAFVVRQRTREIGIRLALGAPRPSVLSLMIKQGMVVCLAGMALGLATAFAASRLMQSVLYGVSAGDPVTYIGVSLLLAATAWLACYLPARRVTDLNAIDALRHE